MKEVTKITLAEAWRHCDIHDKSTEFMLQYMQDMAGVDLDCVIQFIQDNGSWTNILTPKRK